MLEKYLEPFVFIAAETVSLAIVVATVGFNTVRAAKSDPVKSLRYDRAEHGRGIRKRAGSPLGEHRLPLNLEPAPMTLLSHLLEEARNSRSE